VSYGFQEATVNEFNFRYGLDKLATSTWQWSAKDIYETSLRKRPQGIEASFETTGFSYCIECLQNPSWVSIRASVAIDKIGHLL